MVGDISPTATRLERRVFSGVKVVRRGGDSGRRVGRQCQLGNLDTTRFEADTECSAKLALRSFCDKLGARLKIVEAKSARTPVGMKASLAPQGVGRTVRAIDVIRHGRVRVDASGHPW